MTKGNDLRSRKAPALSPPFLYGAAGMFALAVSGCTAAPGGGELASVAPVPATLSPAQPSLQPDPVNASPALASLPSDNAWHPPAEEPEDRDATLYEDFGRASWYGAHHQGRRTASGVRYDMNKMTAAHPSLPLDTTVRVTNLENGRMVKVTINDRGPYFHGRIIDLSAKAAQRLGMKDEGVAPVKLEVLAGDQPNATEAAAE